MPIGIVSDDDFDLEIDRLGSKESADIVDMKVGRGNGNGNTPASLRKVIGETAITDGNGEAKELVKQLGGEVSDSSVSAYKNGATSTATYNEPNQELVEHVDRTKEIITGKAKARLISALTHITNEKLEVTRVKDLSGVAKDMSAVIKNMEPSSEKIGEDNTRFVFLVPHRREERSFEVIDVKE